MLTAMQLDSAFKLKARAFADAALPHTEAMQVNDPFAAGLLGMLFEAFRQGRTDAASGPEAQSHTTFLLAWSLPKAALRILERIAAAQNDAVDLLTFAKPVKGRCAWVLRGSDGSVSVVPELTAQPAEPILTLVRLGLAAWQDVGSPASAFLRTTDQGHLVARRERLVAPTDLPPIPADTVRALRQLARKITTTSFRLRHGDEMGRTEAHIAEALRHSYNEGFRSAPLAATGVPPRLRRGVLAPPEAPRPLLRGRARI